MLSRYLVTAAVVATLVACSSSKDSTSPSVTNNTASSTQVSGMMAALGTAGAFTLSPTALASCTSTSCTLNATSTCPGGGTVTVTGNYSFAQSGQNFTYSGTVNQSYAGCKSTGGGATYQFDGTGLTMVINATVASGAATYSLHETGNMVWSSGSSSGTCPVDFTVALNSSSAYTFTGTYCGLSVSP